MKSLNKLIKKARYSVLLRLDGLGRGPFRDFYSAPLNQ
jgi:hypothetical protein